MPPVSKRQARAMFAAAEGRSTLGIPRKVGKEFTAPKFKMRSLPARARKRGR